MNLMEDIEPSGINIIPKTPFWRELDCIFWIFPHRLNVFTREWNKSQIAQPIPRNINLEAWLLAVDTNRLIEKKCGIEFLIEERNIPFF
ncbi:uncharacterized protein CTRU02_207023 [Colletotrichum truncatum]|uniref:Uncharacterized protein n=1 Tax=Colletotrichum truncatum TaxID=5467 RepID=A0ACC3YZU0_COLTU|nr:uncharacterized protein CTRU02_11122 [Colletotrichum truncatum]KAF6786251.1 hypothetical protein CTRU02_11122 [Colletotrichum truncatum]